MMKKMMLLIAMIASSAICAEHLTPLAALNNVREKFVPVYKVSDAKLDIPAFGDNEEDFKKNFKLMYDATHTKKRGWISTSIVADNDVGRFLDKLLVFCSRVDKDEDGKESYALCSNFDDKLEFLFKIRNTKDVVFREGNRSSEIRVYVSDDAHGRYAKAIKELDEMSESLEKLQGEQQKFKFMQKKQGEEKKAVEARVKKADDLVSQGKELSKDLAEVEKKIQNLIAQGRKDFLAPARQKMPLADFLKIVERQRTGKQASTKAKAQKFLKEYNDLHKKQGALVAAQGTAAAKLKELSA